MDTYIIKKQPVNEIEPITITNYMDAVYQPKVEVYLSHDSQGFHAEFKVYEKQPLAEKTQHLSNVHEDSCVEWFVNFTPDTSEKYFNFEVNANGIMNVGYRADRLHNCPLSLEDIASLHIQAEVYDEYWTVSYTVPVALIGKYAPDFDIETCSYVKGNLYKCGDFTETPHYGFLFPVDDQGFHQPKFFGIMKVE